MKEDLELLMARVEETRDAQKDYFHNRTDYRLTIAKVREKALDAFIIELRRRGFNGDKYKLKFENTKLF